MYIKNYFIFLINSIFYIDFVFSVNILMLSTVPSHSHSIWNRILVQELAKNGHNVTFLTPDFEKNPKNYTVIHMDGVYEKLDVEQWIDDFENASPFDNWLLKMYPICCELELQSNGFKQLLEYPKHSFDLVIIDVSMDPECFYPLIKKVGTPNVPIIGTAPFGYTPWDIIHTGDWIYPAIYPDNTLQFGDKMSFWQRFLNFYVHVYQIWYRIYITTPQVLNVMKPFYGPDADYSLDLHKRISLTLYNVDPVLVHPRPYTPNAILVGGLHAKLRGNMPKDVGKFLDDAKEGAIFFSLGSNIRSDVLDKSKKEAFLQAFAQLPYKVLWKFESDDLPGKPDNVMINKWLPQPDVLNHPNVKLFITHCGGLSSQETIHFQKPIVGVPVFLDQQFNAQRLQQRGLGLVLKFSTLNTNDLVKSIREVIENPQYTKNIERISSAYLDRPETPLERAMFWIEYVIRHKGAKELQPASKHMAFYQTYCLDVIAVTLLIIFVALYILKTLVSKCLVLIKPKSSKQKLKRN